MNPSLRSDSLPKCSGITAQIVRNMQPYPAADGGANAARSVMPIFAPSFPTAALSPRPGRTLARSCETNSTWAFRCSRRGGGRAAGARESYSRGKKQGSPGSLGGTPARVMSLLDRRSFGGSRISGLISIPSGLLEIRRFHHRRSFAKVFLSHMRAHSSLLAPAP
jgi:hypothetical protein